MRLARWGIRVSQGCSRLGSTWITTGRLTRFWDGSLQPPAKTPRARKALDRYPTLCGVISTSCGGNNRIGPVRGRPRRRVTRNVLTRLVRTARGSAPRVSRTITSEYHRPPRTGRAPRAASRPRSSSVPVRERRPGRPSGPPATMSPMPWWSRAVSLAPRPSADSAACTD
jgi:hypothetical protein